MLVVNFLQEVGARVAKAEGCIRQDARDMFFFICELPYASLLSKDRVTITFLNSMKLIESVKNGRAEEKASLRRGVLAVTSFRLCLPCVYLL